MGHEDEQGRSACVLWHTQTQAAAWRHPSADIWRGTNEFCNSNSPYGAIEELGKKLIFEYSISKQTPPTASYKTSINVAT